MSHYHGQSYLRQLLVKATEYLDGSYSSGYDEVEFFYRCKSDEYFREVKRNNNVMEPIMKDFNGDPKSPINGKIKGVFLGVDLRSGMLPTASPFGSMRVAFPIEAIFTIDETHLYFTDFYCTVSSYHYVTLVLTKAGSAADYFCHSNLLELDPFNNPFLWKSGIRFKVVKENDLHVEVFYTENVYLDNLAMRFGLQKVSFASISTLGKGSSTWGGLKKKYKCSTCNPTSNTQTTSSLIEKCLYTSRSPPKPVYVRQSLSTPILKVRSHTELDDPKPNVEAGPIRLSSESGSIPTRKCSSPWWNWLTKWPILTISALLCVALYLSLYGF